MLPLGEEEPITVDARVIAATNKDLEDEISKGNFREDLFYRLNVIPFYVPPLRERKEDIPQLARYFLKEFSQTYSRRPKEIADDAARRPDALLLAGQRARVAQPDRAHRDHESHGGAAWSASTCRRWSIARAAAAPWATSPACTRRAPPMSATTS